MTYKAISRKNCKTLCTLAQHQNQQEAARQARQPEERFVSVF